MQPLPYFFNVINQFINKFKYFLTRLEYLYPLTASHLTVKAALIPYSSLLTV